MITRYANGLAVTHAAVVGGFLVWDGVFVADDEVAVRRAGYAVVQRLWTELERRGFFAG